MQYLSSERKITCLVWNFNEEIRDVACKTGMRLPLTTLIDKFGWRATFLLIIRFVRGRMEIMKCINEMQRSALSLTIIRCLQSFSFLTQVFRIFRFISYHFPNSSEKYIVPILSKERYCLRTASINKLVSIAINCSTSRKIIAVCCETLIFSSILYFVS